MFLLYRVLAYSAGRLIAAAAYQFLRYRGRVRNKNLAVFLLHRFVRELGAAKRAVPPDVQHQAAWSSAGAHWLRAWKSALPEMASWVQDAPDL